MPKSLEDKVEALEGSTIQYGLAIQSLTQFQELITKPLIEQFRSQSEQITEAKGVLKTLKAMTALLGFLIMAILGLVAWMWPRGS